MIILLLGISTISNAKPIKVLEIDTGIDISHLEIRNHINIANWTKEDFIDTNGHGTHIAGLILDNVCDKVEIISCKFYNGYEKDGNEILNKEIACFKMALKQHVNIINFSGGGGKESPEELKVLKQLSELGIKIVVAAGNNGQDLSDPVYNYYPAKYSLQNIIVVGNLEQNKKRNISSNYGLDNMVWEIGTKVLSTLPASSFGYMTGTSQSTARRTNRILRKMCLNE